MGKIKDLPIFERPREKAFRYGTNSLSNVELLAILVGSGTKGNSAIDIAQAILNDAHGLLDLSNMPLSSMLKFKGLNKISALKLVACFELSKRLLFSRAENYDGEISPAFLFHKYYVCLAYDNQESLIIIVLNKRKKLIYEGELYRGSDNNISFSFRDIFRMLILHNGYFYYLIHNHPNGKLQPSEADFILTSELIKKSEQVHIPLLDHIIITKDGYYTFINQPHVNKVNKMDFSTMKNKKSVD